MEKCENLGKSVVETQSPGSSVVLVARFDGQKVKDLEYVSTGVIGVQKHNSHLGGIMYVQSKVVEKFNDTHNHPLINTPTKVKKFFSHSGLRHSGITKSLVSKLYQEGLTSSKISKVVNAMNEDFNITPIQISTIISSQRHSNVGRECQGIVKHFQRKSVIDRDFYFDMHLAEDGTIRSVFWADCRSRAAYAQFGEVLVFDVTYKTNKFKFPFAHFVGVNHHGQSILFAAALVEDETEATFTWLFEQFRTCMFDRSPVAIITDQDKAMGKSIAKIFPGARHRFCAWHLKKHVMEHSQSLRAQFKDNFDADFREWYKSQKIDEFEGKWEALKNKYDIRAGSWLANMYTSRHHWAKAYLKDTFFAGMTTSGRSESINSFFDGYVNSNTMLNDFVIQYDKAIKSRRDAEEDEDFKTINTKAILETAHPIEAIAGKRYTRKMFEIFKKGWKAAIGDYFHEKISTDNNYTKYRVGSREVDKKWWAIVDYHLKETFTDRCSCAKFETMGILCRHILYIMKKKQMMTFPEKYILSRWTMDTSYRVENFAGIHIETTTNEVSALSLWLVQSKFTMAISEARDSISEVRRLDAMVSEFLQLQLERKKKTTEDEMVPTIFPSLVPDNVSQVSHINDVRDPTQLVKTKGRPRVASRIKSSVEMSTKQQRTCSYCQGKGHYKTGCQKLKYQESLELLSPEFVNTMFLSLSDPDLPIHMVYTKGYSPECSRVTSFKIQLLKWLQRNWGRLIRNICLGNNNSSIKGPVLIENSEDDGDEPLRRCRYSRIMTEIQMIEILSSKQF
ncbi:protein FAR1-RELATED SEQUENCE 5-like [Gastrolobium bilobum]|uniref:protein FAR1-RELATED SEQUENCE 5-like n=1 Tax=Gastrolobium bilobum TaxID=150636 RepID=UPI002AB19617|nr:protein FAR1-RELATED SEQUENCE 5-like [Gastrolobium bilobum]